MKQWGKYSMLFYRILAPVFQSKLNKKSFEKVLKQGLGVLDEDIIEEIKHYVISQQNNDGGFSNKAGKSDVYYSLFGYFLCQGLGLTEQVNHLRKFTREKAVNKTHNQVDWFCKAILYKQLVADKKKIMDFKKELKQIVSANDSATNSYQPFLSLLAFYYFKDYHSMFTLISSQEEQYNIHENKPTPVMAAKLVLLKLAAKDTKGYKEALMSRYDKSGGFRASLSSPLPDLLSTSVSLYAMVFANANLSLIKPACFEFINRLFENGGFVAYEWDDTPDIEYTFYGLLALGALDYHSNG